MKSVHHKLNDLTCQDHILREIMNKCPNGTFQKIRESVENSGIIRVKQSIDNVVQDIRRKKRERERQGEIKNK